MGCAASREGQGRSNKQGYWYDREENLITVNFTDSEPESDAKRSEFGSEWSSDFESTAIETLPTDVPEKAIKVLLDPENRIDSGIWMDNISITEYDPEDYPVFEESDVLYRKRAQSLGGMDSVESKLQDDSLQQGSSQRKPFTKKQSLSYSGNCSSSRSTSRGRSGDKEDWR